MMIKLITLAMLLAMAPLASAVTQSKKSAEDLNRVSATCKQIKNKDLKEKCLKNLKKDTKKDLNRVKFNGKKKLIRRG